MTRKMTTFVILLRKMTTFVILHEEFLDGITFTGSRYSVKLPWKEGHDRLPDNYLNSLSSIKSQLKRLKREPELLKKYDTIIREQVEAGIVEEVAELNNLTRFIIYHTRQLFAKMLPRLR